MTLDPFTLGIDYRELSPREGRYRWRWELTRDMAIPLPFVCRPFSCRDEDGWEWMRVEGGVQHVRKFYRWNGASPKKWCRILNRWIGSPDTIGDHNGRRGNLRGTCSHDALYQASGLMGFPISRQWADELFGAILRHDGFRWANLYQGAVIDFGGKAWCKPQPKQRLVIL
jgi:hypothetical protein